jgi:hypothetical protein
MIGRIRFEWAGDPCVAELSDGLAWTCDTMTPGADVARWLNSLYNPRDELSPSRGRPGVSALVDAAGFLEGTIEWGDDPDEGEHGRIY